MTCYSMPCIGICVVRNYSWKKREVGTFKVGKPEVGPQVGVQLLDPLLYQFNFPTYFDLSNFNGSFQLH